QLALRVRAAAWRDLADVGVVGAAGAVQVDERAVDAPAGPRGNLDGGEIFDREAADDRNALALLVRLVGVDRLHDLGSGRQLDSHAASSGSKRRWGLWPSLHPAPHQGQALRGAGVGPPSVPPNSGGEARTRSGGSAQGGSS